MPNNRSETTEERERRAEMTAETTTLQTDKAREYPASLNQIPKEEQ